MIVRRVAVVLVLFVTVCGPCVDGLCAAEPRERRCTLTIPSTGGVVGWDEVGARLLTECDFDGAAIQGLLPEGTLDLEDRSTRLSLYAVSLATGGGVRCRVVREGGDAALQIRIDRDRMRKRVRLAKRLVRERLGDEGSYGLALPRGFDEGDDPLVIVVHGLNGTPRSLEGLRECLGTRGYECGIFTYPNDGPLEDSAELLAEELDDLRRRSDREVVVVAVSMGALVTRAVIEDPDLDPGNVGRLIMIAPPNHGSQLARVPLTLDWWEHLRSGSEIDSALRAAAADGLNEARSDLRPDSVFLSTLNSRPRNERVRYSILLGSSGLLDEEESAGVIKRWEGCCERSRFARLFDPRVRPLLEGDELVAGLGDRVVSIESGCLEGVDDVVVLPFRHSVVARDLESDAGQQLVEEIVRRLPEL